MLYTPDNALTLADLRSTYKVPTKTELRERLGKSASKGTGSRWTPVHHANLVTDIHRAVEKRGMAVKSERFQLSEDTHSIFGYMEFEGYSEGRTDMAPVLGFRSDNLQRFRLVGVTGSRVFVCANGMIVGDFVFGFKHTTGKVREIEVGIDEGLVQWERQAEQMHRLVEFMEEKEIDQSAADHLLFEALRARVVAPSQLGKIDTTYREYLSADHPHHSAFAPRNAWSLYNAVTEVAKGWRSPLVVERGLKGFPRVVADTFGFEGLDALADVAADPSLN